MHIYIQLLFFFLFRGFGGSLRLASKVLSFYEEDRDDGIIPCLKSLWWQTIDQIDMGFNRFHIMKMYEISGGGVPSHFVEWSLLRPFGGAVTIWVWCSFPMTRQQQVRKILKWQWWIVLGGSEPRLETRYCQGEFFNQKHISQQYLWSFE